MAPLYRSTNGEAAKQEVHMREHGKNGDAAEAHRMREEARFLEEEARRLQDEERRLQDEERRLEDRAHELEEEAEAIEERRHHEPGGDGDDDGGGGDHRHGDRVLVKVVVTGQPTEIEARREQTLGSLVGQALEQTGNVGQPADNWEMKDLEGNVLDLNRTIGSLCAEGELTLFLSLKAGAAGA